MAKVSDTEFYLSFSLRCREHRGRAVSVHRCKGCKHFVRAEPDGVVCNFVLHTA